MTGWDSIQAQGRSLREVFNILNEVTREPLEDPVTRALREGNVIAVTDQTVLVNRDSPGPGPHWPAGPDYAAAAAPGRAALASSAGAVPS